MKVAIVNCFDTYEQRIDLLYEYFIEKGHDVYVIESDFRHFQKVKRTDRRKDFIFIKSKPYYKNMSIDRLTSHYKFAKHAFEAVENINPDVLYVMLPPNSLAKFAGKYKRKHSNVKLCFDIIDLWPETMPIGKMKVLPPFTSWRRLRDKNLKEADFIITECDRYQSVLKDVLKESKTETIYLAKSESKIEGSPVLDKNEIQLCYLGSINNIIDIYKIKELIKLVNELKPTTLNIIGDGESKDILIDEINSTGATVKYHGKIYDSKKKQEIFDKCHFGLNIMKDSVCVGLTMKSIDYFQHGLPIINNIQFDTAKLVDKYSIGINILDKNVSDIAKTVVNTDISEILKMRDNTHKVFDNLFSKKTFNQKIEDVVEGL